MVEEIQKKYPTQTEIFGWLKSEILSLKSMIIQENVDQQQISKIRESLSSGLIGLYEYVWATEKSEFQMIVWKIESGSQISDKEFTILINVLTWIEWKQIEQAKLDSLSEAIGHIRSIKPLETTLKTEVVDWLKDKVKNMVQMKDSLIAEIRAHPFLWWMALSLLPASLKKEIVKESKKLWSNDWFSNIWFKFGEWLWRSWLASLILMFFGWWLQESVDKMSWLWESIPEKYRDLNAIVWTDWVKQLVTAVKDTIADVKEWEWLDLSKFNTFKDSLKSDMVVYVEKSLWIKWKTEKIRNMVDSFVDKNASKFNTMEFLSKVNSWATDAKLPVMDIFIDQLKATWMMIDFIMELLENKIVWYDDIAISVGDNFIWYWVMTVKLLTDSMGKFFWEISLDKLQEYANKVTLSDTEKEFLAFVLYRKWWLVFSLLWSSAWLLTKFILYPIAEAYQDVSEFGAWKNAVTWNLKKQQDIIRNINSKLWSISSWSDVFDKAFSDSLKKMDDFYEFWSWYSKNEDRFKKSWKTLAEFISHEKYDLNVAKRFVNDDALKLVWNNTDHIRIIRGSIAQSIQWVGTALSKATWDLATVVWTYFKWVASTKQVFERYWSLLDEIAITFKDIIGKDEFLDPLKRVFKHNLKLWSQLSEFVWLSDNLILSFKNPWEAKIWIEQTMALFRKSPESLKFLFWKVPILAVAWLELTKDDPTVKWFLNDLMMLVPVVWPMYILWNEAVTLDNWKIAFTWSAIETWFALWFLWYDSYYLVKECSLHWFKGLTKAIGRPFVDMWELWVATSRAWFIWSKYVANSVRTFSKIGATSSVELWKVWLKDGIEVFKWLFGSMKNPRVAILALSTIWAFALYGTDALADDQRTIFEKEFSGLLKDWDLAGFQDKLIAEWGSMNPDQRKDTLENIVLWRMMLSWFNSEFIQSVQFIKSWVKQTSLSNNYDWSIEIVWNSFINWTDQEAIVEDLYKRLTKFWLVSSDIKILFKIDTEQAIANLLLRTWLNKDNPSDLPAIKQLLQENWVGKEKIDSIFG